MWRDEWPKYKITHYWETRLQRKIKIVRIQWRETMKRLFEKWYVLFMLLRIAHHNKVRMKFEKKYDDVFYGYGQDLEHITLEKYYERDNKLYEKTKELKEYVVARRPQRDDFGLYEYVDQHCGWCEDDYYGTIYTKTPFRNRWLERSYHC